MSTDNDKAAIGALIESIHKAHHHKDAATIIAPYARDALVFDLAPPLSHVGMNQKVLEKWLDTWEGPVDVESRDLEITVRGDLAFCHGFYRTSATTKAGERAVFWTRATVCLLRDAAGWKIVHEHTSVPFYMDGSYRAATDLQP